MHLARGNVTPPKGALQRESLTGREEEMAATATSQVTDERELDSDGQEPEEAILADEAGEVSDRSVGVDEATEDGFDLETFEADAKDLARAAEKAEREIISAEERARRAADSARIREERKQRAALKDACDAELKRLSPAIAMLAQVSVGRDEEKAAKARHDLERLAREHFMKTFPSIFTAVDETVVRMLQFVSRGALLRQIERVGNRKRMMAELLASEAFFAEGVRSVSREQWDDIEVWNRLVTEARWKRDHGRRFDPEAAKAQKIKRLSLTYKVEGEERVVMFAAGERFGFKALVDADNLIHEEARREYEFFKNWEGALKEFGERVSVVDLFTRPELVEATAAFKIRFFLNKESKSESQLVGMVVTRSGNAVALEAVAYEKKPGIPRWFDDLMPEDPEAEADWYEVGVDAEDPDLRGLPRLLARAVRMAMSREGFKFPDYAQRGRETRGGLNRGLKQSLFGKQ